MSSEEQRKQAEQGKQSESGMSTHDVLESIQSMRQARRQGESSRQTGSGRRQGQGQRHEQGQEGERAKTEGREQGVSGMAGLEDWRRTFESALPPSVASIPINMRAQWTQRHLESARIKMENILRDIVLELSSQLDTLDLSFAQEVMTRIQAIDPLLFQLVAQPNVPLVGAFSQFGNQFQYGLSAYPYAMGSSAFSPLSSGVPLVSSGLSGLGGLEIHMTHAELLRQVLTRQGSENNRAAFLQHVLSSVEKYYLQQFGMTPRQPGLLDARAARLEQLVQEVRLVLMTVQTDSIAEQRDRLIRHYVATIGQMSDQMISRLHGWSFEMNRSFVSPSAVPTATGIPAGFSSVPIAAMNEPRVDIFDHGDSLRLCVYLPGVRKEDVNVDVQESGGVVVISGQLRESEARGTEVPLVQEQRSGRFCRKVNLPYGVEASSTHATFDNGILEITLNKQSGTRVQVE